MLKKEVKTLSHPKISDQERQPIIDTYEENHKGITKKYTQERTLEHDAYIAAMKRELKGSPGYARLMAASEIGNPKYTGSSEKQAIHEASDSMEKTRRELAKLDRSMREVKSLRQRVAVDDTLSDEDRKIRLNIIDRDYQKLKDSYEKIRAQHVQNVGSTGTKYDELYNMEKHYRRIGARAKYNAIQEFKQKNPEAYKQYRNIMIKNTKDFVKDNAGDAAREYLDIQRRYRQTRKEEHRKIRNGDV